MPDELTSGTHNLVFGIPELRAGGTKNFADWQMDGLARNLDQIKVGDFLFKDSVQFDALNLCEVTKVDGERRSFYARFVNPSNPEFGRNGIVYSAKEPEFCVWESELLNSSFGNRFLKAVRTEAEHLAPSPKSEYPCPSN